MSEETKDDESFVRMCVTHEGAVNLGSYIGILLALLALGLLVWAENYAVATTRGLEEGAGKVVEVKADKVDAANEGKLVHVSGEATTAEPLVDPDFGISTPVLKLMRTVETYQWKETKKETKKDDKTITSYTYSKEWATSKPKTNFEDPKGHVNPEEVPYKELELASSSAKLGAFMLTENQLKQMKGREPLAITDDLLKQRAAESKDRGELGSDGKLFVSQSGSSHVGEPEVGDVQVSYFVAKPQVITVVAKQTADTFAPYESSAGTHVDIIEPGAHDTKAMFAAAHGNSRIVHWAIRIFLTLLLAPAIFLMIRPMALESGFDLMGKRVNIGFLVFATFAATGIMLVVVGVRWLIYQPVFGGEVLAIGIATLFIMRWILRRFDKSGMFTPLQQFSKDEIALFRQVALDPNNTKLRLQLADLLTQHKNPLGEFIRVDLELDGMAENDSRRTILDPRWSALFEAHTHKWFLGLKKIGLEPVLMGKFAPYLWLNRGVIEKIDIYRPKILPKHADRLFLAAPGLREIDFHGTVWVRGDWKDIDKEYDFPAIFALPHLEQIGELDMSSIRVDQKTLEALATSPHLKNLKRLVLNANSAGVKGIEVLANSTTLRELNDLELRSSSVGDAGAVALAKSPILSQLTQLHVSGNDLTAEGVRALATSQFVTNLTNLDFGYNNAGAEGAASLAASANLSKLSAINLGSNNIGPAGFRALAESSQLTNLKKVELPSNEIDAESIRSILTSRSFGKLEELDLSNNGIGDAGAEVLASWPGLAHVKKLSLSSNSITGAGIRALASSPFVTAIKELELSSNEGGISAARALVASETLTSLKTLKISYASLTPEGEKLLKVRFGEEVSL
jgi:uncharacterized protein (TIGR02996 family)